MPYSSLTELPEGVHHVLPTQAQRIFKEAFNSAWDEYKDRDKRRGEVGRDEVSRKVAWAAVKKKFQKGADGKWHPIS